MNATTLAVIFDAKIAANTATLPLEDELDLIAQAQRGIEDAYLRLLRQYAPGLRGMAKSEYERAGGTVDADETRANVLLAFATALSECDGSTRVAAKLKKAALHVADEFHLVGAFTVPERTRQRYFQALREAGPDGDPAAKAVELGMTREIFTAVREAVGAGSFEYLAEAPNRANAASYSHSTGGSAADSEPEFGSIYTERGYATVEQTVTVARAFAAVDGLTGGVIRDAYGFTEYDPIPDAEIAHRRGFSRSKVQRIRTDGVATMRAALGVDEEAGE